MSSPSVLDIEGLLNPIPGDEPAGSAPPFVLKEFLDQARKEINPAEYDPSDPTRPTEFKRADWQGIIEKAGEALRDSSKDLMLAARLSEALARRHGFAGLRDGLRLLRRMVEQCWDRLRPLVEEPDDLEARAAPFNWLDDSDRGSRFPVTVRCLPILSGETGALGWLDWPQITAGKGPVTAEVFEKAVVLASREHCQAVFDDLGEACAEMEALTTALAGPMGEHAPGLSTLRRAMLECHALARMILERKGPAPAAAAEPEAGDAGDGSAAAPGGDSGGFTERTVRSRAQIYQRLAESADALQQIEPHSPVPYVIRWAVSMGGLSYPELMKRLVTDRNVLNELSRVLGIPELLE